MIANMAANPGVLNPDEFGVAFVAGDVVDGKGDGSCAGADDCDGIGSSGCVSALVGAGAGVGRSTVTPADTITPSLSAVTVASPALCAVNSPAAAIVPTASSLLVHTKTISDISR